MRSVVNLANHVGIAAIVDQQFKVAAQISAHGLVPIIEPEVSIKSPEKAAAEEILRDQIEKYLDALTTDGKVMLKLTIPTVPDLYAGLIAHPKVERVVALSGGYTRDDACKKLAANHEMIASFSRALVDGADQTHERRRFQCDAWRCHRRDLQGVDHQGLRSVQAPLTAACASLA